MQINPHRDPRRAHAHTSFTYKYTIHKGAHNLTIVKNKPIYLIVNMLILPVRQ